MKLTDLEKNKGAKINNQLRHAQTPGRYAAGAAALPDRREQRKRDQALGLIPFAVKLDSALVKRVHDFAAQRGGQLNEIVAELLNKGLDGK